MPVSQRRADIDLLNGLTDIVLSERDGGVDRALLPGFTLIARVSMGTLLRRSGFFNDGDGVERFVPIAGED